MQSLYNAKFLIYRTVISDYKETILQRNYRKMTILWSFSYNFFVKFIFWSFPIISFLNSMVKKIGSHNMTMLNQNMGYNKVCYKGTAL